MPFTKKGVLLLIWFFVQVEFAIYVRGKKREEHGSFITRIPSPQAAAYYQAMAWANIQARTHSSIWHVCLQLAQMDGAAHTRSPTTYVEPSPFPTPTPLVRKARKVGTAVL